MTKSSTVWRSGSGPGYIWVDEQLPRFACYEPSKVRAIILRAKSKLRRGVPTKVIREAKATLPLAERTHAAMQRLRAREKTRPSNAVWVQLP